MKTNAANLENIFSSLSEEALNMGLRILAAIVIFLIGRLIINRLIKRLSNLKGIGKIDETAHRYILAFTRAALYTVLIICIVAQLGVAMSSVVALLATAGAAIGLALQGALSNFAGGLMLLIFRPFTVGDYIISEDNKGYVQIISLIYTTILTFDNNTIMIPNGNLMNSNIINATSQQRRRVDLSFEVSSYESPEKVRSVMLEAASKFKEILKDPAPVVATTGIVSGGTKYALRVWADREDYWTIYEGLTEEVLSALNKAGIARPSMSVHIKNNQTV